MRFCIQLIPAQLNCISKLHSFTSPCLLWLAQLYLYILCIHYHRLMVMLCICHLDPVEDKKWSYKITAILDLIFAYVFTFTRGVSFCIALSYCLASFHFNLQDFLQHFSQNRFIGSDCHQLLFIWDCFNFSLSFLKDSFVRYRILSLQFFPFNTLNMSSHCLLASKVSAENFSEDPLCGINFISMAAFKILYLSFGSLIMLCFSVGSLGLFCLDFFEFLDF